MGEFFIMLHQNKRRRQKILAENSRKALVDEKK
jgi:hypothetical protein